MQPPPLIARWPTWLLPTLVLACAGIGLASEPSAPAGRRPQLSPDYTDLVIPPGIAPLNFTIEEPGLQRYEVRIVPELGAPVEVRGTSRSVILPAQPWRTLLHANAGRTFRIDLRVQDRSGKWQTYDPVTNTVSADGIDGYLVYRLLRPVYNLYGPIGIYQRDLGSFDEKAVLENRRLEDGCLNCHTFLQHRPDRFALHIRHKGAGNPMLLVSSNAVTRIQKTSGYLAWHPTGRLLTFSVNKFVLMYHTTGETRDLFDSASDLGIYRVDSNTVVTPPAISLPDRQETWPSWSPDGRFLYFCSAPKLKVERFKQVRYDLMRVAYDIESNRWGEPEVMVSARETALSAAQPRVSPDGRWLLFCLSAYGNFPAYQASSDLYLMDLLTRRMRRLEINSDQSDSWHCWSTNGRWVVFSSKRRDGLFTRPYFSHVDEKGRFSKPWILPQRDPGFYDSFTRTFNLPELVQGPVTVPPAELARAVFHPRTDLKPVAADTATAAAVPEDHEADEGRSAGLGKEDAMERTK